HDEVGALATGTRERGSAIADDRYFVARDLEVVAKRACDLHLVLDDQDPLHGCEPLAAEGRRQPCPRPSAPLAGRRGRRGRRRRRVDVLTAVPLVGLLLEPLPTLVVPRARTVAVSTPAAGPPEDPSDQEERSEQEEREQEEPGEEVRPAVPDDVDD